MPLNQIIYDAIVEGDLETAIAEVETELGKGENPQHLLDDSLVPAMDKVGELFESNEYFVPELLISARVMQGCMAKINPCLKQSGVEKIGRVVIGTVQGDMHDIGKNLVASMLEGSGFDVIDLGVDVSAETFLAKAQEKKGTIIGLSALLTTTMPAMKRVVELRDSLGLQKSHRIMIGGAPVTQEFADQIHADGYSENANAAVALARQLVV
ncbi:MAG: corrinoid protein [Planctomycetaceae bacterium]|jgi:corrinoid protein of di/trimethylamine methyltransferase|nr:corrinoid protein [Planctomycetaceae bacterium]